MCSTVSAREAALERRLEELHDPCRTAGGRAYAALQKSGVNIRNVWRASLITDSAIRQRLRMRVPLGAIGAP